MILSTEQEKDKCSRSEQR